MSGTAVDSLAVRNLGLVFPFVYITGSISFNRDWDHNGKYRIFLPNSEGHKRVQLKGHVCVGITSPDFVPWPLR